MEAHRLLSLNIGESLEITANMETKIFSFKSKAKYQTGAVYTSKDYAAELIHPSIQITTSSEEATTQTKDPDVMAPVTP